jgi:hypothetical protein
MAFQLDEGADQKCKKFIAMCGHLKMLLQWAGVEGRTDLCQIDDNQTLAAAAAADAAADADDDADDGKVGKQLCGNFAETR